MVNSNNEDLLSVPLHEMGWDQQSSVSWQQKDKNKMA